MEQFFNKILKFDKINSTNEYGLANIESIPDRALILSDIQTEGHGRFDRKWQSCNCNNLYFSIILKPAKQDYLSNFTQYMSVVIAKTIEKYEITPNIKWPNDVRIKDKKIAGILAKSALKQGKIAGIVLGVGINLNSTKKELQEIDQPATSLNIEIGKNIDKYEFLANLSKEFFLNYEEFQKKGFLLIKPSYEHYFGFFNKEIAVKNLSEIKKGTVIEINDDGTLCLLDNWKNIIKITIGDILC